MAGWMPDTTQNTLGRSVLAEDLGWIRAGRVLDVATGDGNSARFLAEHLGSFAEIVGVDRDPPADDSESIFGQEGITFVEMDTGKLACEDGAFGVVAISSSLHHLEEPIAVLVEMKRVLAPGGWLIVRETHRDVCQTGQSGPTWSSTAGLRRSIGSSAIIALSRTSEVRFWDLSRTLI